MKTPYEARTTSQIEIRTQKPYLRIPRGTRVVVTDEHPKVRKDNGKRCMRGYVEFNLCDGFGQRTGGVLYTRKPEYGEIFRPMHEEVR